MSVELTIHERGMLAQALERLELAVEQAVDGHAFDATDVGRLKRLIEAIEFCDSLTMPTTLVRRLAERCAQIAPGLVLAYMAIHETRGMLRAANKQGG